jgi:spermidine synthase
MGGMALGAWIAGVWLKRIRNCLKWYGFVEIALGIAALIFHSLFQLYINFSYETVLPFLNNPVLIFCYKWITSSLIILPQSMLLGSTFPLMAAGFIRRFPGKDGYTVTFLYFANTFGASIGVLLSGFVLIGSVGLHGTIVTAGVIDSIVGFLILYICWKDKYIPATISAEPSNDVNDSSGTEEVKKTHLILIVFAGATAAASFIYEIGWIRMLSLVLGSSTHSFEMMLSSFILGMALGSFFIRNKIDKIKSIPSVLVIVQVIMGATALISILVYSSMFHLMKFVMAALSKSDQGYVLFNIFSDAICMLVMLPSTICAGMVLPLIVHFFYRSGRGEENVGRVYAINTFGGIIGVIAAVWILMPFVGVRFLVTIGALIDMGIGLYVLFNFKELQESRLRTFLPALAIAVTIVTVAFGRIDPILMSSGVFRNGKILTDKKVLSIKDGRTATVALYQVDNHIVLSTNGKVDASVDIQNGVSGDEYTMSLAAVIPLAILSDSCDAAVIGMGSGMTAHYMLMDSTIKGVDVVEIEPAMVEAARHIGKKVENTFNDPRSHIYIDDAKTFFSSQNKKYDLIVSEPSNPWVSGVSGLFSKEFFERIRCHLNDRGVLVQWFHQYESDITILSSIFRALRHYLPNYQVYTAGTDLIVIAAKDSSMDLSIKRDVFKFPSVQTSMSELHFQSIEDLRVMHYCSGNMFNKLLNVYDVRENSDYNPYVDLYAVKHRFTDNDINELDTIRECIIPVRRMLDMDTTNIKYVLRDDYPDLTNFEMLHKAKQLYNEIRSFDTLEITSEDDIDDVAYLFDYFKVVPSKVNFGKLHCTILDLFERTMPYLSPSEMSDIWNVISRKISSVSMTEYQTNWMKYFDAWCQRDFFALRELSFKLLPENGDIENDYINNMLLESFYVASKITGNKENCESILWRFEGRFTMGLMLRLLTEDLGIQAYGKRKVKKE